MELEEFVREAITRIKAGVGGNGHINGTIKFEVFVIKTEKMGGNVKIFVASGGGNVEKESVQKISSEVDPNEPNHERESNITPWIPEVEM
ncbi:MAG: hypothetical protein ACE5IC_03225 [Candidatus Brocadiales bacterium]